MDLLVQSFSHYAPAWRDPRLFVMEMATTDEPYMALVLISPIILSRYYWLVLFRNGVQGKLAFLILARPSLIYLYLNQGVMPLGTIWTVMEDGGVMEMP